MIPIRFVQAAPTPARPPVTFDVLAVPAGGRVTVRAASRGGWVFDNNLSGAGPCVTCAVEAAGAALARGEGFSGDETRVDFSLAHDGVSAEVVVTFHTRAD
jgi:hypothetical protein